MSHAQKDEILACILFYEERNWDWSDVVEFLIRRANGTLR